MLPLVVTCYLLARETNCGTICPRNSYHAENEQTKNRRHHDSRFEPEELAQLVRAEEGQRKMYQPEQEES